MIVAADLDRTPPKNETAMRAVAGVGVWGAVERKTGLGACHCKMIGIPASKAGQFMKRKKSYAKPRRASVAD